ncbi:MAG: SH3 domain-containing protein [Anaerolineae bacterium]|nr:SH3 domain-containing protein [Anaerolineae bacterium]
MSKHLRFITIVCLSMIAACTPGNSEESLSATATLAPIVSMTPRFTATPVATRTPLPTFTLTPSETPIPPTPSDTPTPSPTPPIIGIIASIDTVNVREGPGTNFSAFVALPPGTRIEVLGQNVDGRWLNVKLEDNREGWVSERLIRLQETATPFPTASATTDLTAVAQGTVFPTAILGGGTVTPTPPSSAVSPTPVSASGDDENIVEDTPEGSPTSFLPVIDVTAINQTATALAGGVVAATLVPTSNATAAPSQAATQASGGDTTPTSPPPSGDGVVQQGVDVLAYCDDPSFGEPAPTNLGSGSTIDIWWRWIAATQQQVQNHVNNAVYTVSIDGVALQNINLYQQPIRQLADGTYFVDWYVRAGPLTSGQHKVEYQVSWNAPISDGFQSYGPGTGTPSESGSCTFSVR